MTGILIVDDEPLVRLTLKSLCVWEDEGFHIAGEAENGRTALEFLERNPSVKIVLTDVDMPVMDGLELSERMRESGLMQDIVFLSSYSNFEYVRRAFKSGACDYILKSEMDGPKLLEILRRTADREQAAAAAEAGTAASVPVREDPAETESVRDSFFRDLPSMPGGDVAARFAACRFSSAVPFHFMVIRPGDLPLVRSRHGNNLYAFRKTAADLLSHFVPASEGDSGAVSFDEYYIFMRDPDAMEKAFERFYEAAWSYLDIGFERRAGCPVADIGRLPAELVSCMRDFIPPSRIVVRTRRYIREHFREAGLSLSSIADYTEVSRNHLSWEFARETGETISDFIARTRIHEAKKLLLETNLRTYEIAAKTGYSNVETFCRAFKKATGTSPRQFT